MIETPRRPTLRLKSPPPMPANMPIKTVDWKCRPCGTVFQVPREAGPEDSIRCPSCNARLGLARDFRQRPPNLDKLRARLAPQK
jgi:DNA-directed RNA polymerase subunit RPC12/RpoP